MSDNYQIILSRNSQKFLDSINDPVFTRIVSALEFLAEDPYAGKGLLGSLKGLFSWRVGKYRIVYSINDDRLEVIVIDIGLRKKIYD